MSSTQKDYASSIQKSANSLLTIINDLLVFSKAEANKIELEVIEFSVTDVVEETLQIVAAGAEQKKVIKFEYHII